MASTLREAIQQVISRGLADPRVRGLITVTGVRVTPDLAEAIVDISVLPASAQELTYHGLSAASAHIRHEVGELVEMRRMPAIRFNLDRTLKKEARVLDALRHVADERERGPKPGWGSKIADDSAPSGGVVSETAPESPDSSVGRTKGDA
jgi:ribosome-binding factor A